MKTYFEHETSLIPTLFDISKKQDRTLSNKIKEIHTNAIELFNKCVNEKYILKSNAYHIIELNLNTRLQTTGGKATTHNITKYAKIDMNYRLFTTTATDEDLKQTYIHELAHVLANRLKGKQQGHNAFWRQVVINLGGNPSRCHNMEVNHLRAAHTKRVFSATCECKEHKVTRSMWNKIEKGSYRCRICKGDLKCI